MSSFAKLISLFLGAAAILYLFTCSTFISFEQTKKSIDHDQLVKYVLTEVDYELAYGVKNANIDALIDKAIQKSLKEK
ncbi:MAG TPA: hypothetical protein EYG92_12415 [Lutibacter sp.]|nr:hypothetical protein [Lutibacter sp.]